LGRNAEQRRLRVGRRNPCDWTRLSSRRPQSRRRGLTPWLTRQHHRSRPVPEHPTLTRRFSYRRCATLRLLLRFRTGRVWRRVWRVCVQFCVIVRVRWAWCCPRTFSPRRASVRLFVAPPLVCLLLVSLFLLFLVTCVFSIRPFVCWWLPRWFVCCLVRLFVWLVGWLVCLFVFCAIESRSVGLRCSNSMCGKAQSKFHIWTIENWRAPLMAVRVRLSLAQSPDLCVLKPLNLARCREIVQFMPIYFPTIEFVVY